MMSLFTRLSARTFIIFGRAGMDLYADPPGVKVEDADRFTACLGGSSANIAVAISRLGGHAALVTSLSDDAVGRFCLNELGRYGIDCRYIRQVGGEARNSLALVDTRIEDHSSVIYRNGAADFQMTLSDVESVRLADYCTLITTGTVLAAEPSRTAMLRALEYAKTQGLLAVFDIDYRPYSWTSQNEAARICSRAAALSDIIVGNDVEFGIVAGGYGSGLEHARSLVSRGVEIVVYKMGEKGAVTITAEGEFHSGIYQSAALKSTGAGDSFLGAFIASLAEGKSIRSAVERGSAAAAIVVSRVGCAPAMPTAKEIEVFMAGQANEAIA